MGSQISSIVKSLQAGVSPACDIARPTKNEFGVLTVAAVTRKNVSRENAKRIDANRVKPKWPVVRKGTVLVNRANGSRHLVGACVYVGHDDSKLVTPDKIWSLDVIDDDAGVFLIEFLRSHYGRKAIHRITRGSSGMWNIPQNLFLAIELPVNNKTLRATIAKLSKATDEHVTGLQKIIAAKRSFKHGLMQQLLTGQKRFPKFNQPWVERSLGELLVERIERKRGDLPLLAVTNDRGVIPRNELKKRDTSNPDKSKYKRVAVGDIAYNTMRMWQGVSAFSTLEGIVSPAYTVAIPTDQIDGRFAGHLFKFPPIVHLFRRYSQGLVDDTLNLKFNRFSKIKVNLPLSTEEQSKIADVLNQCDREIGLLDNQKAAYEDYKNGLLSRLLSGELELPVS